MYVSILFIMYSEFTDFPFVNYSNASIVFVSSIGGFVPFHVRKFIIQFIICMYSGVLII